MKIFGEVPQKKEKNRAAQWGKQAWNKIVDPSDKIENPTTRFQARLVTITIFALLVAVVVSVLMKSDLPPLTLVLLVVGYLLSRTKYYTFSAFLVIINISFFVIVALFDGEYLTKEIVFMTIAWFTPSLILSGLIFSIRQMLWITFFHFMVPFLLPIFVPELGFKDVLVGGGFLMVVSVMILMTMFLRDLHEKEKQKELASLNEELEDRVFERTAQLESFSYSVSHDLRAPLRAIRGFSEILQEEYGQPLDDEANMYLEKIKTSSKKMDYLIDDLLMLSRLGREELDFQSINLKDMAEVIFQELIRTEENPDAFTFSAKKCPMVMADRQMVNILLTNLISNAIKFSRGRKQAEISFGCQQNQEPIEFYLKDNGIGFDAQLAEIVVRPFQRLHSDEEFEGTGIGLAIVNNIINRHNGNLRIEALPDKGTTIFFSL
ncbi:MAG: ATP-binding protein [Chloroflexota bacterium]